MAKIKFQGLAAKSFLALPEMLSLIKPFSESDKYAYRLNERLVKMNVLSYVVLHVLSAAGKSKIV